MYFLFLFSLFVLNFALTYEIRKLRLNLKISALNTLGTFVVLIVILIPEIFLFHHRGVHYRSIYDGILAIMFLFVVLYSGYVQVIYSLWDNLRNEMLDKILVVVSNFLWLTALVIIGRSWYSAPMSQGYYGSFFSMILFFYVPMISFLLMFKMISRKLLKIKFPGYSNNT